MAGGAEEPVRRRVPRISQQEFLRARNVQDVCPEEDEMDEGEESGSRPSQNEKDETGEDER